MTGNYFLLITFSFLLSIVIAVRNNGLPFPRSIAASVVQKSELAKYLSVSLLFSCGNVARAGITELVRSPTVDADQLVIPLDKIDGIYYVKYVIGGALFRAIVDTGSPFLIVPSICTRQWGGCRVRYLPTEASSKTGRQSNALAESAAEGNLSADPSSYELPIMVNNGVKLADTKLSPTVEIFGGQDYDVDWKMADVSFPALSPMPTAVASTDRNLPQSQLSSVILKDVIVGQAGLDIMRPPGGVFFGLIKDTRSNIRPSFLSQTNFRSFKLDTSTNTLTLSKTSMIMPATKLNDPFPLVQDRIVVPLIDLRSFGDPVCHYAAKVSKLIINEVEIDQFKEIYAIFDTGSTGCVLSDEIANDEGNTSLLHFASCTQFVHL